MGEGLKRAAAAARATRIRISSQQHMTLVCLSDGKTYPAHEVGTTGTVQALLRRSLVTVERVDRLYPQYDLVTITDAGRVALRAARVGEKGGG
jgi:hypothetical protein